MLVIDETVAVNTKKPVFCNIENYVAGTKLKKKPVSRLCRCGQRMQADQLASLVTSSAVINKTVAANIYIFKNCGFSNIDNYVAGTKLKIK